MAWVDEDGLLQAHTGDVLRVNYDLRDGDCGLWDVLPRLAFDNASDGLFGNAESFSQKLEGFSCSSACANLTNRGGCQLGASGVFSAQDHVRASPRPVMISALAILWMRVRAIAKTARPLFCGWLRNWLETLGMAAQEMYGAARASLWMQPRAIRISGGVASLEVSVPIIVGLRSQKQMRRFDASRRVAAMAHACAGKDDSSVGDLIGDAMGREILASYANATISSYLCGSDPQTTSGIRFRNGVSFEAFGECATLGHVGPPSQVRPRPRNASTFAGPSVSYPSITHRVDRSNPTGEF